MGAASRRRPCTCALLVALALTTGSVRAADPEMPTSFVWGFGGYMGTTFPECGQMHIKQGTLPSISAAVKPPYTLIAYEKGGITTAQTLGSDPSNLIWTVNHKSGAQLALSMTDAAGKSGGISPTIYTVISNSSTTSSCHSSNPNSTLSFTTNATATLSTCDVFPLKMTGGQRPYTVTLASPEGAFVMNFTLGQSYDTYHWVSKATTNSSLVATVSDAAGQYASQTLILKTTGGLDHSCNGMQSMQLDSTGARKPLPLGNSNAISTISKSSGGGISTGPIVGSVLGGLTVLGAFITGLFYFFFRKRRVGPRPLIDDDGAYTESGLRGIVPFRVNSHTGPPNTNTSGPARYTSSREKTLPPEPGNEGAQSLQEGPAVYQHADISDVVELPPAYQDRT